MSSSSARPEDRRRPDAELSVEGPPACYRSEAFAEDLGDDAAVPAPRKSHPRWRWLARRRATPGPGAMPQLRTA